jgi:hypothetical protein
MIADTEFVHHQEHDERALQGFVTIFVDLEMLGFSHEKR